MSASDAHFQTPARPVWCYFGDVFSRTDQEEIMNRWLFVIQHDVSAWIVLREALKCDDRRQRLCIIKHVMLLFSIVNVVLKNYCSEALTDINVSNCRFSLEGDCFYSPSVFLLKLLTHNYHHHHRALDYNLIFWACYISPWSKNTCLSLMLFFFFSIKSLASSLILSQRPTVSMQMCLSDIRWGRGGSTKWDVAVVARNIGQRRGGGH